MTQPQATADTWYRNPWVWLVIAIPGLTVAGCMLTIYLALTNPHILTSDGPNPGQAAGNAESGAR